MTLPNLPVPLNVARIPGRLVVTTDAIVAASLADPPHGAWTATPLCALAGRTVDAHTFAFSISDTPSDLRTLQGYLAIALIGVPLEAPIKQAILNALNQFIIGSSTAVQINRQDAGLLTSDNRGLFGIGSNSAAAIAIIAAIAIPNLLESRISANESAAATSLKSIVFLAEIAFQKGLYHDRDQDGVGDYGFFTELAGGAIPGRAGYC